MLGRLFPPALIALVLVALTASPARADHTPQHTREQIDELGRAIQVSRQASQEYRASAARYDAAVAASSQKIAQLAAAAAAAQSEADAVGTELAITEEQLALTSLQLEETRAQSEALDLALAATDRAIAERERLYAVALRAAYRQLGVSPLEMLLDSSSLTQFVARVQGFVFVSRENTRLAGELRRSRAARELERTASEEKRAELQGLEARIAERIPLLAEERARYTELAAGATAAATSEAASRAVAAASATGWRQKASATEQQARDLEREQDLAQERLAASLQGGGGPRWSGGKLTTWPMQGTITSPFGPRWGSFHYGIDIAAPFYRPVVAAAAGTVQVVGKPYLAYGDTATVVIIKHADNFSTVYGHLDDAVWPPVVRVGQFVQAGQIIGYNGSTGFSTGPHLEFKTILNGRAVDPMLFLP